MYECITQLTSNIHLQGRIIDSAFTWAPNPKYGNLLQAVKAATNTGIKVIRAIVASFYIFIANIT